MKKEIHFTSNSHKLVGILNKPKNATSLVVCAHGWTSSKNSKTYLLLERKLEKEVIAVLRFDFYSHGQSEGRIENMTVSEGVKNVLSAIKYARSLGFKRIGLFGSSFGGLCSSLTASKVKINALVLKSPVSEYKRLMLGDKEKKFLQIYGKFSAFKAANKINCPVLIVHGNLDDVVPLSQSKKLSGLIKDSKLIIVKGLTHDYNAKQLKAMTDVTVNFFKSNL